MLFHARSGRSATAGHHHQAAGSVAGGLSRTPSLVLVPHAPTPTTPCCAAAAAPSSTTCSSCSTAALHPSHPLYQKRIPSTLRASAVAPCRASPDGVAAAVASAAVLSSSSSTTATQELLEYVIGGPLLASCGLSPEGVRANADEWCALGARLALQLGFIPAADENAAAPPVVFATLDPIQRLRIYRYYLPVFFWVRAQLDRHTQEHSTNNPSTTPPPLVLGISAPQGCGKTTLTEQLTELFTHLGTNVAGVSIDDFYLTRKQQQALADANPGNRLLELRGNAGSHDLALGEACLRALRDCRSEEQAVAVPRYDKSAFGGKGDRAPESEWPRVKGPVQLVLFEGWMLGFRPTNGDDEKNNNAALTAEERRDLVPVDAALRGYKQSWDSFVDSWLVVRVGDPRWVFAWRLQAEQAMRASGKAGMSDEAIADFVSRYLPAYGAYLPSLYASGPTTAQKGKTLVVEVDERRSPVEKQPALPQGL
jgi:D-glycerate 3-kinase